MAAVDSTTALMAAARAALLADAGLTAIVGTKVFDSPPVNAATPYLEIGATSYADWSTDSHDGQAISIDIHCWDQPASQAADTRRCRTMMERVRAALQFARLTLAAPHVCVLVQVVNGVGPMRDPDGSTLHGVVTIRALVHQA